MNELSEENSPFTAKQEKVLICLLNGETVKDAAKANKITETTIYLWLQKDEFKSELRRLRREAYETSFNKVQSVANQAIETLEKNLTCGNPSAEIRAAQILLEQSSKAIETLDILERLEVLENAAKTED